MPHVSVSLGAIAGMDAEEDEKQREKEEEQDDTEVYGTFEYMSPGVCSCALLLAAFSTHLLSADHHGCICGLQSATIVVTASQIFPATSSASV